MLIKASFNQEVSTSGDSMVFIPEGIHNITPRVNGVPKNITVRVKASEGEKIAARLQASFEERNKVNPIRSIIDFDHQGVGAAAALPKRFYYEKGKGIMVERELTGSGEKAIKAKDYSYFSPEFLIGNDGVPSGLPERGPLGALVNDPAFRDIPRIAASRGDTAANHNTNTMDDLVTCGLLTSSEAAKPNAGEIAKQRVSAMNGDTDKVAELNKQIAELTAKKEELEGKVKASDAAIQQSKEDNADRVVKAAVAAGRIAPKDEENQKFWKKTIINDDAAVKALDALPQMHPGITQQRVNASAANPQEEDKLEGLDKVEAALAKEI